MADITSIETSLMNQMVAGKPVSPKSGIFAVINDEQDWPITIFVGTDDGLALARRGPSGNPMTISLSKRLNLPGKVRTLAASQEQTGEKRIYLAFTSDVDGKDVLHLTKPFLPSFDWTTADASMLLGGDELKMSVQMIYMPPNVRGTDEDAPPPNDTAFPAMYVTYKDPERPTQDVCMVDTTESPWRFRDPARYGAFQMPSNPQGILAMQAAQIDHFHGLVMLYKEISDDKPRLTFVTLDTETETKQLFTFPLQCPPGASSLATYVNELGHTALLVGGNGLFHFTPDSLRSGTSETFTQVSSDEAYQSPNRMLVAQSEARLSLWSHCNGTLRYHQLTRQEDTVSGGESVPLVSCAKSTTFGATLVDGNQRLFVLEGSELQMLMQDEKTELWKTEPFSIPSMHDYREFNSYTTVITMAEKAIVEETKTKVRFASSIQNNFTINGELFLVGTSGVEVEPDQSGCLTIILPVDDLGAPIYTVTPPHGAPRTINPMLKVNEKLGNLKTGTDMANAKDQDGGSVFAGSGKTLEDAAIALKTLREREAEIKNGNIVRLQPPPPPPKTKPVGWGFFKWFAEQIQNAAEWAIKKVGDAVHFIITLAGKALSFVVDTVTQVAKAISSVLETIGAGIAKLIKFVGNLFRVEDYVDMQRLLCNVANHALYSAWSSIDDANLWVHEQFEKFREQVNAIEARHLPKFLQDKEIEPKKMGFGPALEAIKLMNSPAGRFGQYQADHGGKGLSSESTGEVGDIVSNLITNALQLVEKIKDLIIGVKDTVIKLFMQDKFTIAEAIVAIGKKGVNRLIDIFKSVANLILRFFSDFAAKLAIELNKNFNIPVLGALFKWQYGKELTLLDAVMFVLAIPLTLVFKLVTGGKSLKDMPGIKDTDLLKSGAAWEVIEAAWNRNSRDRKTNAMDAITASGVIPPLPVKPQMFGSQATSVSEWIRDLTSTTLEKIKLIIPILGPTIGLLLFNFYQMPKYAKKGASKPSKMTHAAVVAKIVLLGVTMPTSTDRVEENLRTVVWSLSAVRCVTGYTPKLVDGILTAASAQLQIWALVAVQVHVGKNKGYDAEKGVKEWLSLLSFLSAGMATVVAEAGEPISQTIAIGAAALLNNASTGFQLGIAARDFDVNKYEELSKKKSWNTLFMLV